VRKMPERNASGGLAIGRLKPHASPLADPGSLDKVPVQKPVGPRIELGSLRFAEVRQNGRVIATVYNDGSAAVASSARLGSVPGPTAPQSGPELAAWRADQLVAANGGSIIRSRTAMTQEAWDKLPPIRWSNDGVSVRDYASGARRSIVA